MVFFGFDIWTLKQSDKACHDEDKNDFIMLFIKLIEWEKLFLKLHCHFLESIGGLNFDEIK